MSCVTRIETPVHHTFAMARDAKYRKQRGAVKCRLYRRRPALPAEGCFDSSIASHYLMMSKWLEFHLSHLAEKKGDDMVYKAYP